MMKNADMPAMPIDGEFWVDATKPELGVESYQGLTRREMFAMHAMQAWITHHGSANNYIFNATDAATSDVVCADALLAELERTK